MSVMEEADQIDQVLVLCRYKGEPEKNAHYAIRHNEELTLESSLWLTEMFRSFILQRFDTKED